MRVALVSCAELPEWEVDDQPLIDALRALGVEIHQPAWDAEGEPWEQYDLAIIRTTWDYWHRRDAFVAWARATARVTTLWNSPEVIGWNTHKGYLRELEGEGLPLAPTLWVDEGPVAVAQFLAKGWAEGFAKPLVGASASDTLRFSTTQPELKALERLVSDRSPHVGGFMIQPFLRDVMELGEVSLVYLGGVCTHGVRKIPVPGDYRVQDDYGATDQPWVPDAAARQIAERALQVARTRFGAVHYARVDLLLHEGNWVLNELELVEPSLFFRHGEDAAERFAAYVVSTLAQENGR